jgi:hypothetical protein
VLLLASLVIFAAIQIKIVVIPVFIALILASALYPIVRWLVAHHIPRPLATIGTLIVGVAALGGIVTLVVNGVRSEWSNLSSAVTEGIDTIQDFLESGTLPIDTDQITEARDAVVDFLTSAEFGSSALAGAGTVVELITGVVLTVVLLFFFLQDGKRMWNFLLTPLRPERKLRAHRVGQRAAEVLGGYLSGTALVALVDAVFIGAALWILQVPLALPLALLVFIGAFIPDRRCDGRRHGGGPRRPRHQRPHDGPHRGRCRDPRQPARGQPARARRARQCAQAPRARRAARALGRHDPSAASSARSSRCRSPPWRGPSSRRGTSRMRRDSSSTHPPADVPEAEAAGPLGGLSVRRPRRSR